MNVECELSRHARDMLSERAIRVEWVSRALNSPDRTEVGEDYNRHYIKAIPEFGGRYLRVVVNPRHVPVRIVTFFFDRRIRTST
ncbi:MAG TPA: DUF4258 domain-containing protein [Dehalococcoidia bacterium]|nr:DUF4258 domain-containing protein [Dehalococcoidia bacterium]